MMVAGLEVVNSEVSLTAKSYRLMANMEKAIWQGLPTSPSIEAMYARQSTTISQASSRYTLKTGRKPPRGYDAWFRFASKNGCIIDDYDQIHRDFAPFYELANDDPKYFQRMVSSSEHGRIKFLIRYLGREGIPACQGLWNRNEVDRYNEWKGNS